MKPDCLGILLHEIWQFAKSGNDFASHPINYWHRGGVYTIGTDANKYGRVVAYWLIKLVCSYRKFGRIPRLGAAS